MFYGNRVEDAVLPSEVVERDFRDVFSDDPIGIYCSPGRVNLLGEHTDYNDGFVLPAAIQFHTAVAIGSRKDNKIVAVASDHGKSMVELELGQTFISNKQAPWSDYLAGVVQECQLRALPLRGLNLVISGNVPQGAGLSSSASLEMALLSAFKNHLNFELTGKIAAKIGQAAENKYVGCKCGIMDQLVSALGEEGRAILLDCRSLEIKSYAIPENFSLLIVNSNLKRGLVDSEYNLRRQQCEEAARYFNVAALRDVGLDQLEESKSKLSETVYRRARHVISENLRTIEATEALAGRNIKYLSRLMQDSHESMRVDFEITVGPTNELVKLISRELGYDGGVRQTGGGFGGCVVALVPDEQVDSIVDVVQKQYEKLTGLKESVYLCSASKGSFS